MNHIVLNEYGQPFEIDDEVVVTGRDHPMYGRRGKIFKIRNYDNVPKISVVFECGNVYRCALEDFKLG